MPFKFKAKGRDQTADLSANSDPKITKKELEGEQELENSLVPTEIELSDAINIEELFFDAIQSLDQVCDGARTDDQQGFAAFHTVNGKQLAAKMRDGGRLTIGDVNWISLNLQYYFNTQLSWVNKEDWGKAIAHEMEKADLYEEELKKEKEQFQEEMKAIKALSMDNLKILLLGIDLSKATKKDLGFIKSLQGWNRYYSGKQAYWVKVFVERYWHLIPDAIKEEANPKEIE